MPQRSVAFHPLAAREFQAAYRWYARRSPTAAGLFLQAADRVRQRLETAAEQGSPYRQHYRWMRLRRFPYLLYYQIRDAQTVLVYAVAHAGRRPGYWLRRPRP
jgi:plasmid stabilization system protein ParE